MIFLRNLFLTGCGLTLLLFLIAFAPETCRFLRDEYWPDLQKLWKAIEARYKRAGLPPLSTIFFFVAAVSLYIIGTAIL